MKISSDFEIQIKIVIIGDTGVGKTNFIFQFADGKFVEIHMATVGFDFKSRIIKLPKSQKSVKLQVWDTAGQERYMSLNKNLFQKVQESEQLKAFLTNFVTSFTSSVTRLLQIP